MVKLPNDERLVVVALGESGCGKSNILNLLLNTPGEHNVVFAEGEGAEPCTLQPQEESGCWRGDPGRQITVFDTPGLGADDAPDTDLANLRRVMHLIKDLSYINCFLIVVKSGTSRFLSQHQKMFECVQTIFGEAFWANAVLDVAGECSGRDKKNLERWINKLKEKFPQAGKSQLDQVYINTAQRNLDTLHELWEIISKMNKYTFDSVKQQPSVKVTNEEQEENETGRDSPDISTSSNHSTNASITPSLTHNLVSSTAPCTDWSRSRQLRTSMSDLLDIPGLPCALPPRSPTFGRRRTSRYEPPSPSSISTSRLPRSYMPSFSSTEDFTSARYSSPRFGRRSFRETSPISSYSCRSSRDNSPSSASSSAFKTVGIPTYLRTCHAYGKPFTKAMRESRLAVSYATEDRILLDKCDDVPYPDLQQLDAVLRVPYGLDHMYAAGESVLLPPLDETLYDTVDPLAYASCQPSWDTTCRLITVATTGMPTCPIEEETEPWSPHLPEMLKARKSSVKEDNSHLVKPDVLVTKNPMNYVKRALLPKVKYHWDQGFRQGTSGWEKVPVIKLKVKYNEEDADLLPSYISVEGGRWCETKRIRLDGHKTKCKLRATEGPEFDIRVIPLDKQFNPESNVPEFLLTIHPGPIKSEGSTEKSGKSDKSDKSEKSEKWMKGEVRPSMQE